MALLTQSEALAFNGFLSNSVDFGDVLEWSALPPDGVPLKPAQGKEALAKATKDLMSLEALEPHPHHEPPFDFRQHTTSSWPSFQNESQEQRRQAQQTYTYGFAVPPSSSSSSTAPTTSRHSPSQGLFAPPRSQSPRPFDTSASPSSPGFPFPPALNEPLARPNPFSATSAPAVLARSASSGSKRSLPVDNETWPDMPGQSSAKRRRPSELSQRPASPSDLKSAESTRTRATRASSITSTASTATATEPSSSAKPALLSPSQKRANHIQSEQKRRANIRKGYDALCEAVPSLRDAIRQEEENAARAAAEEDKSRKRKRKAKNAAAEEPDKPDGRAGPKSENVVLQKTIDHLNDLLAERLSLKQRLEQARNVLGPAHPAVICSPNHLDDKGVPLWEREWNGGSGWGDGDDDGGGDD